MPILTEWGIQQSAAFDESKGDGEAAETRRGRLGAVPSCRPRRCVAGDRARSRGARDADAVVVTAAARVASALRPEDTVARLDGDVFGALLTVPRELVPQVVERVQRAIGSPYSVSGTQCTIRSVCGVVSIDSSESVNAA